MKTVEIIGFKRANLTKSQLSTLRYDGSIPAVLYGGGLNIQFHAPAALFKDLIYTPEAKFVKLNIEGTEYKAIKQEIQFHPVNDMVMHVDFLLLEDGKEVKMNIPVALKGTASGVLKGGKLVQRLKHVIVKAMPKNMPELIELDVTNLEVGKAIRVSDIETKNFSVLKTAATPIAAVEMTRAMKEVAPADAKK
ncbi:MAG: 50S ribosomal protein L25/general stress protein Ctc [Cytophagales bacterium]|nr:MAG: 50S ribosomal protein L25/general stress protein Ctc [Cytophagales bacterium]